MELTPTPYAIGVHKVHGKIYIIDEIDKYLPVSVTGV